MKYLLLIFSIIGLVGCGARYQYVPESLKGSGPYHAQVSDNLFRIHYKVLSDDRTEARSKAIQLAAKLTREQELDWFVVLTEQTITEQPQSPNSDTIIRLTCGEAQCQQTTYSNPSFHRQFPKDAGKNTSEVILQIRMGKGFRPHGIKSFDAYSGTQ
ncbi:CC0125/CC1285 family lipoprotein [Kangiella sediminilitoris]|uniref:Lipoprotein n=1 Tax=Kangiella sediminilitoris TaxID=1144748 RepID=A0A1B3B7I9_9GAMM|nr:hypothetical protein [Kangiella sediminilitoris]AOE48756.1 hypothetical protein KS2013_24 [Kangiella sediminilitoris]